MPGPLDVYVLLMVIMNPAGGGTTLTSEYYTKTACEQAAKVMLDKKVAGLRLDPANVRWGCSPKLVDDPTPKERTY